MQRERAGLHAGCRNFRVVLPSPPVRFSADDYHWAAQERVSSARRLHDTKDHAAAVYWAGIGVECILRAYRVRTDPEFDSRHDLSDLLKLSGLESFVPEKRRQEVAAALGDVWSRWKNDYRYASADRLLRAWRTAGLTLGIRGDPLKENARIVVEAAEELVGLGVARWKKG